MNALQIKLERLKKAAHLARFDPSGKPFKEACDTIERLERTLRSITQYVPDTDLRMTVAEIKALAQEALA